MMNATNIIQHRTDSTDAFDTLYIGYEKFPYHDSFSLTMSGVVWIFINFVSGFYDNRNLTELIFYKIQPDTFCIWQIKTTYSSAMLKK